MKSDKELIQVTNKWLLMLVLTLLFASGFYLIKDIKTDYILEVQFSQYLSEFNTNLGHVNPEKIKYNTYYDFLFIIIYSLLFYFTYRVFQTSMRISKSKFWIILCFIPGILDIIENLLLLYLLNDNSNNFIFNVFWFIVRAKWTFVIPFFIINFTIIIYYIIRVINKFFIPSLIAIGIAGLYLLIKCFI